MNVDGVCKRVKTFVVVVACVWSVRRLALVVKTAPGDRVRLSTDCSKEERGFGSVREFVRASLKELLEAIKRVFSVK